MGRPWLRSRQVALWMAALVLGGLVSLQWQHQEVRPSPSPDQVGQAMRQLELEQEELKRAVGRLRGELDAAQEEVMASTGMLDGLRAELARQKMHAGLIAVRGPGVRVTLDDSRLAPREGEIDLLIHDYDLRDVIYVLWLGGAEAMAINGERVVNSTSVYCVGSTIMVNDTRLSPPYELSAVGDSVQMQEYLRNPGYLSELRERCEDFGLGMESVRVDAVTLPAYRGSLPKWFLQPGS